MTKNFRLKKARQEKHLTQKQLGELIGVKPAYITTLEGNKSYSYSQAERLAPHLDVTADWLFYGNDSSQYNTSTGSMVTKTHNSRRGVPYYNTDMLSKINQNFTDITDEPEFYIDVKPLNGCTAYFPVYGSSMSPKYNSGDVVGVKQATNIDFLQWGESYFIVANEAYNNFKAVKNVHICTYDPLSIILRSENPQFDGDMVIEKTSILSMHLVMAVLKIQHL